MSYSDNTFRLAIESSSGPYIKIQILNLLKMCYGIPNTYMLWISIHYVYQCHISIMLVNYKILLKQSIKQVCKVVKMSGTVLCD